MSAFIETLQAQLIQVQGAIFGGNRFVKENGQVVDLGADFRGFSLDSNGILKASGAEISGHIEAGSGKFRGEIDCGTLQVRQDPDGMLRFPSSGVFPANTTTSLIKDAIYNFLGIPFIVSDVYRYFIVDSGQIQGKQMRRIGFSSFNGILFMRIYAIDNTAYDFQNNIGSSSIWFQLGNGIKKLRLIDLPNSPGGTIGTVFKRPTVNPEEFYLMVRN